MVVKSPSVSRHFFDLQESFDTLARYQLKLNPAKCSFGVQAGKFLGFLLTHRGIEANPDKCSAIINMRSPATVKEVQQLTGRMASLSHFLSKAADKSLPLFQCLRKNDRLAWTDECERVFGELKQALTSPPILTKPQTDFPLLVYLSAFDNAVSAVLVQEKGNSQLPIYFVSRVLQGAEVHYQKIEKLALTIVITARKLRHYFQSYEMVIRTDYPIRQVLQKPDLAGRMIKWSIELSEFAIKYEPRGAIKAQVLADVLTTNSGPSPLLFITADFLVELTPPAEEDSSGESEWILSVDGASNLGGSGARIVLEGPGGILLEHSLRFEFRASNNQEEYEALLAGMALAKEMGATNLSARSDSQLVTGQVAGTFQAKDPQLARYLEKVKIMSANFTKFSLNHVPREPNSRADLLSKLASTKKPGATRSVIQETLTQPSISEAHGNVLFIQEELDSWMGLYIAYLTRGELPEDKREASLVAMDEVHSGMRGSHIGGQALVYKVARAGYFWPSLRNDCVNWVQKCDGYQRHATLHHSPAERLHSILSPWPFNKWGIDILGPFPIAVRQLKFLIVAVDYFSKWIEAEPVATIFVEKVRVFLWKNVVCRYDVPQVLVSDNGTQFASSRVRDFCKGIGIRMTFTSVEHPQSNGQAESTNKVILSGLKKRVQDSGASWVDELPRVLWSYHTTVHSSTQDTPFNLVYGTDAMIPIKITEPSVRSICFTEEESEQGRRVDLDLITETRERAWVNQAAAQRRAAFKYNTKVVPRDFVVGDLILKRAQLTQMRNKLSPKWVGPYKIDDVVGKGAYRLRTLDGGMINNSKTQNS
uniref:Retrovirus-related Pol polyprotein from transposon 17.6 n=1 Tax=Cajanus cajan TaxID=3821 RepID=A0A151SQG9_CAJCA|nr:Retrovirus-related Pol polyprotein from transposon 17.6 [Cajanus cajan]